MGGDKVASQGGMKGCMGRLQDRAMFALIGRQIIYNVSWEDPRVDCELLNLKAESKDTILMLTSGGCNVLDMALEGAHRVVAADLNPRQNALLELKIVAIKNLEFEQFFAIFAESKYDLFCSVYPSKLRPHLGEFSRGYWDENKGFFKSVMWSGMSGWAAKAFLNMAKVMGLGPLLEEVRYCETLEEQRRVYRRWESRCEAVCRIVNATKRVWCPFIAVPANQLHLFDGNIAKHAVDNLFLNTHIAKDNYFYHGYIYGKYTRECCPRYLKAENWERLRVAVDHIDIRTGTLQDVASTYPDGFFSRYILLDHMDWMPMSMILDEWTVFAQKARADCRILWRSFSPKQHIAPLKYLQFHEDNVAAALAMYPDRVAMYNSTHLATIPRDVAMVPRTPFAPSATCGQDLRVLMSNWCCPIRGSTHKARLESFYADQASSYDVFRHRFLHGRVPMIEAMPVIRGGVWVDLGGGTAANLEHLKDSMSVFKKVVVLDLCKPLLEQAQLRVESNGWSNVELVEGDATDCGNKDLPPSGGADLVTMSYSLTMIPDWQGALENAYRLLRPGGYIAIADFTVTEQHSLVTRKFWPALFKSDGVRPTPAHLAHLRANFREVHLHVDAGGFPYVPLLKAPFYYFVGQKRVEAPIAAIDTDVPVKLTARRGSVSGSPSAAAVKRR